MATSIAESSALSHHKRLENLQPSMAKADLKKNEMPWREQIGRAIERCFSLAGLSQKEASALLDRDPAQVARWVSAAERPQLDALLSIDQFRQPLIQALSECAGAEVEVTVRLRRAV